MHLQGVPLAAPYTVALLGPVVAQQYAFAVVSDPLNVSLFVLAREPAGFLDSYNTQVAAWLKTNGFTQFWNRPTPTFQGPTCAYVPPP